MNYNYEETLQQKFGNNHAEVLRQYNYLLGKDDDIKERIEKKSSHDDQTLKDIINSIVLWKINRMIDIVDLTILQELNSLRDIKARDDVKIPSNKGRITKTIENLLQCKGVRMAMASTFLHFFNPEVFPIVDKRAYRVIFKEEMTNKCDADKYLKYHQACVEKYEKIFETLSEEDKKDFPFSKIDKYLYQLDIEAGNKLEEKEPKSKK